MAVNTTVNLATAGIAGITEFVAAEVTANITAAGGSAYAVTGTGNITITLPLTPRSGDVIYVKNLLTDAAMPANNPVLTIARNTHDIDGREDDITSNTRLEAWILTYINPNIGWMVIAVA